MTQESKLQEPTGIKKYFKEQNIEFSFNRIAIQGLGGMAHGLFASLLIGTIIKTIGGFIPGAVGAFLLEIATYTGAVQGAAMALAIGYSMGCAPYVLYSLATVGFAANALGGGGGPLAVYFISLVAIFFGKLVSKRTPVDLLVTPTVTILVGVLLAKFLAPTIGQVAVLLGDVIMWATEMQPFLMGILVSVIMGIVLTLPISSAAICAALGLVGLAGGAAVAGCCAQMVGFAVCTYRENKVGGLTSIATCVFKLTMNGAPVSAGMGTCGLVGPIGVVTGWLTPGEAAITKGLTAITPGAMDWIGMVLICFVLPAILAFVISEFMRKMGWIKEGDYKLV